MEDPLIWIIDEEWNDYDLETALLREAFPGCDIRRSAYDYEQDLENFGRRADAIIAQVYASLPGAVINTLARCRIIAVYGGGYDRVDIGAARQKGIAVTNVSGYCAEDLADYVMAAVYHGNKRLGAFSAAIQSGNWGARTTDSPPLRLSRSVLHIIGLGYIGRTVAKRARALNMTVSAYDPHVDAETMSALGVRKTAWDEGLAGADYISINAILIPETVDLINYEDFKKMKRSAWLINTARGKVINEGALRRAAAEKLIRGAVLDVIAHEPPSPDEPILAGEGILVTPHVSYISRQSYDELKRRAAGNVILHLRGAVSADCVN
ncbi:MAG: C-terminal binding protein [Treponema sp.]|jgi:phosphoglycerate dehydrogenase-like enzyme|nr:C-terminal binding protein [Treponema sp.]